MPKKGMRSLCFHSKTSSFALPPPKSPTRSVSSSEMRMERAIEAAEPMIVKWNPDSSTYARFTSLFYEEKQEALKFIEMVNELQQSMHAAVSENSTSERLVHAQVLMEVAMKRLENELYQMLTLKRTHLDPESVSVRSSRTSTATRSSASGDSDDEGEGDWDAEDAPSISMADLKCIADCMISSGYAKECMAIYKKIRKSIMDEGIFRLGVEKMNSSQLQKMKWEAVEGKIKSWLEAVKVSVTSLFSGERVLCDVVFEGSDPIRHSCFADVTKEAAAVVFGFPEVVVRSGKSKSPEKIFSLLDMYRAVSEIWHEIEEVFSPDSTSSVRSLAQNSLARIGESVRTSLADFESAILKDSSKTAVPGGGVHPLTIDAMNHLCRLSDYSNILGDIISDDRQPKSPSRPPLPESYFYSPDRDEASAPAISVRLAWLVLVLVCKLDSKAKNYKDVSLSYLFLANNLQHVASTVRASDLQYLLGAEWIVKLEEKVRQFAANYERIGWGKVFNSLLGNSKLTPASPEEAFKRFNSGFEEACSKQRSSVVPDHELRQRIKATIEKKIVPAYRKLHDTCKAELERKGTSRSIVKYDPEEIVRRISELFAASSDRISSSSISSSLSSRRH